MSGTHIELAEAAREIANTIDTFAQPSALNGLPRNAEVVQDAFSTVAKNVIAKVERAEGLAGKLFNVPAFAEFRTGILTALMKAREGMISIAGGSPLYYSHGTERLRLPIDPDRKLYIDAFARTSRDCAEELRAHAVGIKAVVGAVPAKEPSPRAEQRPRTGRASPSELAEEWGTAIRATQAALNRWRSKHADGYIQNTDRKPNEPEFIYERAAVWTVMEDLLARQTRREVRATRKRVANV